MTERTNDAVDDQSALSEEERARANDLTLGDESLTQRELQFRNYLRRLIDWTPDNITIIRNGRPLNGPGLAREIELGRIAASEVVVPTPDPTVIDVDDDGNLRMSDGTIRVNRS